MAETALIVMIFFGVVAFLIAVFIIRWVFGIGRIVNAQEASLAIQIYLAKRQGLIADEDVKRILDWTYGPGRSKKIRSIMG